MRLNFLRYGGLSSVRQEGYDPSMPGFHSPPARRGIYALVEQTIERFLLSKHTFDPRRMEWVRDNAGNRVLDTSPWGVQLTANWRKRNVFSCLAPDGNHYLARHGKPRRFSYEGPLWHHLPVRRCQILQEKGQWVLTTALAHKEAFCRERRKRSYGIRMAHGGRLLDEFEVFIEKV